MPRDPGGPSGGAPTLADPLARRALRGWLILGVAALSAAGAMALLLALSRTPGAEHFLPWDPQTFFRRALVTHVVLAFVLWFLAMLGGLCVAARGKGEAGLSGLAFAVVGTVLLVIPALAGEGEPQLANYVPVLNHPLFLIGLGMFALGAAIPAMDLILRPGDRLSDLAQGTRIAAAVYILALLCVFLAWQDLPKDGDPFAHADTLFWGAGHLLQIAFTALLLASWQSLGAQAFMLAPLPRIPWRVVCALLLLAAVPGPILYFAYGGDAPGLRLAFTRLYWIALPIPAAAVIGAVIARLRQGPHDWRSPAFLGLALSVALFAAGGLMGLFADGTDTRTPAHYHAEIGGVNLAFMGLIFAQLLPAIARPGAGGRAFRLQFWIYAAGQSAFSLGMFVAGAAGVARKVAGAEQGLDTLAKKASLGLTGAGGAVAVIGGVLFIWLALRRLLGR